MDFIEVSACTGENCTIAWRRLILTCALSLVEDERKERLSVTERQKEGSPPLPPLSAHATLTPSSGNFDIYRSGQEMLPDGPADRKALWISGSFSGHS